MFWKLVLFSVKLFKNVILNPYLIINQMVNVINGWFWKDDLFVEVRSFNFVILILTSSKLFILVITWILDFNFSEFRYFLLWLLTLFWDVSIFWLVCPTTHFSFHSKNLNFYIWSWWFFLGKKCNFRFSWWIYFFMRKQINRSVIHDKLWYMRVI